MSPLAIGAVVTLAALLLSASHFLAWLAGQYAGYDAALTQRERFEDEEDDTQPSLDGFERHMRRTADDDGEEADRVERAAVRREARLAQRRDYDRDGAA